MASNSRIASDMQERIQKMIDLKQSVIDDTEYFSDAEFIYQQICLEDSIIKYEDIFNLSVEQLKDKEAECLLLMKQIEELKNISLNLKNFILE